MDILVSSFERLLLFLAYERAATVGMDDEWNKKQAGQEVGMWLKELKSRGGFGVHPENLWLANRNFENERVIDEQTLETIKHFYVADSTSHKGGYVLDPHSAVGVAAALRSIGRAPSTVTQHISLATAHPAKFADAVVLALKGEKDFDFNTVLPKELDGLEKKERKLESYRRMLVWMVFEQ
jgi:threonine synthase